MTWVKYCLLFITSKSHYLETSFSMTCPQNIFVVNPNPVNEGKMCLFVCALQVRSLCWWIAHVLPPWSPAAPWSASSWTGLASSASSAPVQTFSNVTSNSTTASSRCLSERDVSVPHPPSPFHPLPLFPPFRPRVHQCNLLFLSLSSSFCWLSSLFFFVLFYMWRSFCCYRPSRRGDF